MSKLRDARIGSTVVVKKIDGVGPIKRRIMDMGITKETKQGQRRDCEVLYLSEEAQQTLKIRILLYLNEAQKNS